MPPRRTHILFDFFGTLVDYSASLTGQDFHESHTLLRGLGADLPYDEFLAACTTVYEEFGRASDEDDHEFSMIDTSMVILARALGREPSLADATAFASTYVAEWNAGVRYLPGIHELIETLGADHRLAVVSNTHWAPLVPDHLRAMGLLSAFDSVVTSVEVGWRKPHPKIYTTALNVLGINAESAIFVGDTYVPDFTGPEDAGMRAYLIDPNSRHPIPADRRLPSIFTLPAKLAADQGDRHVA
jgi:putative hydrolase of the HAD superfamily